MWYYLKLVWSYVGFGAFFTIPVLVQFSESTPPENKAPWIAFVAFYSFFICLFFWNLWKKMNSR